METLSCQVVRVGSSPQKAGFLVLNWSLTLAKARADADSSGIYLFQILRYQVLIAQGFIYRNHQVHPHTSICLFRSLLCDRCGSIDPRAGKCGQLVPAVWCREFRKLSKVDQGFTMNCLDLRSSSGCAPSMNRESRSMSSTLKAPAILLSQLICVICGVKIKKGEPAACSLYKMRWTARMLPPPLSTSAQTVHRTPHLLST
jgi:hypothetical protein